MAWERIFERSMSMNERVWERHANPWSAWTRVATAPFLFLAIWSHVWIGWWALAPVCVIAVWTWINPRAFPPPRSTENWASHGVMGERIWLNRRVVPIPRRHRTAAQVINVAAGLFAAASVYGFVVQDFWAAALGYAGAIIAKMWFVDRMAWLYADMRDATPEYASWARGERAEQRADATPRVTP